MRGLMLYRPLEGALGVVIGGGRIAARKATQLKAAGARVRCVAPSIDPDLECDERVLAAFSAEHLDGASVAMVATDDAEVNHAAARVARERGVPVNVADDPAYCDFYLPAVVRRGAMTLGVSTGGTCSGFVVLVCRRLET